MSELDIDAIKARLEARRGLPVFLTGGDIAKTQENKQGVYRWYFHGTWDDAGFFAEAPGYIAALITEVETLRGQVEAVRAATANHPDPCEKHPDGDTVTCGWKSAYQDVVRALEAA